jgi:hypothetical protein
MHYQGGNNDDVARSISEVTRGSLSQGYILAGYTESTDMMPAGYQRNLYLVKDDNTLDNKCHYEILPLVDKVETAIKTDVVPIETTPVTDFGLTPSQITTTWLGYQVCVPDPKTVIPGDNAASPGLAAVSALEALPGPVRRGEALTVGYSLSAPASVRLTVADVAGRVVYTASGERSDGRTTELISTEGWSAGTYFVTVSAGFRSASARALVVER